MTQLNDEGVDLNKITIILYFAKITGGGLI